jgi:hypothetical protein
MILKYTLNFLFIFDACKQKQSKKDNKPINKEYS